MRHWKFLLPLLASTLCFAAQPDRITGAIDSGQRVAVSGHVHRYAKPEFDQGRVESSFPVNEVTLLTMPTPEQQKALRLLVAQQQDPKSLNFHKWLTPELYADRFGLNQNDVKKISGWLTAQGFTVERVARGRNWIVFKGNVGQLESAFRTEIHYYQVDGQTHFANATVPSIPAALAGIANNIRGLDNFLPKASNVKTSAQRAQSARPDYYDPIFTNPDFVAPGDVQTIYDMTPLYNAGIDGTGQKMAVIGQTDVYLADLNDFRSGFGLNAITGCTTGSTGLITSCDSTSKYFQYVLVGAELNAPSTCGDLTEADLDLEWSGAIARNAQIIYVNAPITLNSACTLITSGGGVFVAYYHAIDNNIAPVISLSYGAPCEFFDKNLPNDEIELTKANALGITFVNSSGDSGAAGCDGSVNSSSNNLAVNGLAVGYPASSPEVTGVGGTAIDLSGFTSNFWGTGNNANGGSAQNPPLPEIAWNDDVELGLAFGGTPLMIQTSDGIVSTGGGISNCSVQTSDFSNCVSGFAKPSWQTVSVPGQPSGRFVPDVSLMASPNFPGYIFCTPLDQWIASSSTASSCAPGGTAGIANALALTNSSNNPSPTIVGGTSASTPIFAGMVVLLNQYLGSNGLGNINPTLYVLAGTPANGAFHHVNSGNNIVYCQGGTPAAPFLPALQCPGTSGTGTIGYDASNADATTGFNLVTGLGSVDVNKLAVAWAAHRTGSSITISPSATNVQIGTSVTFSVAVTPSTGVGTVSFSTLNNGTTTVLGSANLNSPFPPSISGTATFSSIALPGGLNSVTATYEGDSGHGPSTSAVAAVTVTVPFTITPNPSTFNIPAGQNAVSTLMIAPNNGFAGAVNFTNSTASTPGSCSAGLPAGALCSFTPTGVTLDGVNPQTVVLTITTAANMALPASSQPITITGSGGGAAVPATVNLTVTSTNQTFTLATTATTFPVAVGGTVPVSITVSGMGAPNNFVNGSTTALSLTYMCTGTPALAASEISCQISPGNGQPTNATAVTVSFVTTPVTAQMLRPQLGRGSQMFYALLLPGIFGVVFAAGSRSRLRLFSLIVVLGGSTMWLGSCGGSSSNTGLKNPGTPPGMYAVTINATTGGANPVTNSLAITLNVTAN